MSHGLRPVRRVVTGNDAQGRSRVVWDSAAPNVNPGAVNPSAGMTDVWVWKETPAPLASSQDDGNLPFSFEPPEHGGHLRIVQSKGKPRDYDPAKDTALVPEHPPRQRPGGTWDRGGGSAFSSPIHQSHTVDYGILLNGLRTLILDDRRLPLAPGDVVVQVGNWHGWTNPDDDSQMAFIMMGGSRS